MFENLAAFFLHWGVLVAALWLASRLFDGVRFDDTGDLLLAGLLLGVANTVVKPLVILLTLPLTLLSLGFFLLVINALMLQLVAWLVRGFHISGFWKALFVSIFISLFSLAAGYFLSGGEAAFQTVSPGPDSGAWI